jgi:hypothetical protein
MSVQSGSQVLYQSLKKLFPRFGRGAFKDLSEGDVYVNILKRQVFHANRLVHRQ